MLHLLPAGERRALTHGCELQHAWSLPFLESLVSKQQLLVNNCSADFGLYHWFSSSWRYVGIGKLWRPNHDKQGGLTRRLFEHLQGAMRPQYREGYKLRYRLSRKTPLWSSMFFFDFAHRSWTLYSCLRVRWNQASFSKWKWDALELQACQEENASQTPKAHAKVMPSARFVISWPFDWPEAWAAFTRPVARPWASPVTMGFPFQNCLLSQAKARFAKIWCRWSFEHLCSRT